ncbi:hypothetical protein EMIHUDRAFT_199733 [Emiliania huxleyi CCMP1516]|uniref:ELMO domain-containing protein n=2 Tax=Emiliania huxleyi TaxID=2903 RepID=A0A0D3L053_EMIH1|nr:hypothetical protein EMIHUDRAFT_199733 [Emiliania huxleyi CCMP1516]EOD41388.1 hypothetical protein EMIHUDRAFT_199733 [Emiliania huxleyi CCMP1516]|eukprot:XP_005793817.1 hypothetical protein EMIHUDRAFT_199733 [Emiliania huxleyi CCMP1516]
MARVATIVPLSPLDPNTAPRAHADGLSSHQRELEDLMSTFSRMREAACTSFHPAAHEYLLRALWTAAFGAADADAFAPSTERWKDLGFQSEEAAKDFRGAGVMGLHHLLAVELHTELAVHLWRVWSERPRDLMGFPAVLDEACADLHEVLQEATAAAAAWAEATDAGARRAEEALMARRRASRLGVSPQVLETLDVCASAVSTLMGQCVCSNGR